MSKDPFQILADELTLIRKDMDQLQRTSLDKDEAKKLNQIVTAAVMKMAKAAEDAPGEIQGALETDRDQMESTVKCGAIMQPFRFRTKASTPDAIARTWRAGCHRGLWFGFAA